MTKHQFKLPFTPPPRPKCVVCDKPHGQRAIKLVTIRWPEDESEPPHDDPNTFVIKQMSGGGVHTPEGDCKCGHPWHQHKYDFGSGPFVEGTRTYRCSHFNCECRGVVMPKGTRSVHRTLWDGKTYRFKYGVFCTLGCALVYAEAAFKTLGPWFKRAKGR